MLPTLATVEPFLVAVKAARPIDWASIALALAMPILVAMEPYLSVVDRPGNGVPLPPVGSALLVAAVGSLIAFGNGVLAKRKAAGLL